MYVCMYISVPSFVIALFSFRARFLPLVNEIANAARTRERKRKRERRERGDERERKKDKRG